MSGIGKALGKIFKAIGKVVKKVLPIVLAVAAVVFTAGAALPATVGALVGTGGMAGAAGSVVSALGISSTGVLGGALTGAITHAGIGAAVGMAGAAITGGDPLKGAQMGALTGAVTGGVTGGFNAATAAIPESVAVTPAQTLGGAAANASTGGVSVAGAGAAAPTAAGGESTGLLGRLWNGVKDSEFAGSLIKGVGQGLLANSEQETYLQRSREEAARIAENYATDPHSMITGLSGRSGVNPPGLPDPYTTRPDENPGNMTGRYVWDAGKQDLVFKPYDSEMVPSWLS